MDIKNAKIDVLGSVGSKLLLIDVIPSYAYVDGRRTSTVTGYKYIVILEENKFDRLSVRIDGDKQIDNPIDGNSRMYALIILNYRCIGQVQDIRLRQRQVLFI